MRTIILGVLLILIACQQPLTATPIQGELLLEKPEPCTDCEAGCVVGTKPCGDACIPDSACCSDADCGETESCAETACQFDCSKQQCRSNQACDETIKGCACPFGYSFCDAQARCIPQDHCCNNFDCETDEKCVRTVTSAEVCIENGEKACKQFNPEQEKTLTLGKSEYRILIENFQYTSGADIFINDLALSLPVGNPHLLEDETALSLIKIRETGGECIEQ